MDVALLNGAGRYAIALLLTLASLASAPIGSMEQEGRAADGSSAHATSVPVAQARSAFRFECAVQPLLWGDVPESRGALFPPARPPRSSDSWFDAAPPLRPLCERLPYDANPPPPAS